MGVDISSKFLEKLWGHFMGKLLFASVLLAIPAILGVFNYPIPYEYWGLEAALYLGSFIIVAYGIQKEPPLFQKKGENKNQRSERNWKIALYIIFVVFFFLVIFSFILDLCNEVEEPSGDDSDPLTPTGFCTIPPDDSIFPPCYYEIVNGDSSTKISKKIHEAYIYAGMIADLHRNTKGKIASYSIGDVIIIPEIKEDYHTTDYLKYYLGYDICVNGEMTPSNPCLYISKGESYLNLAKKFFNNDVSYEKDIKEANDIQYLPPADLEPMDLEAGVIVVIPSWPR